MCNAVQLLINCLNYKVIKACLHFSTEAKALKFKHALSADGPSAQPESCLRYINIHTHQAGADATVLEIVSRYRGQPEPHARWQSVGLHPWHLEGFEKQEAQRWMAQQAARPEVIAIGEAGLDKITPTPWETQITAFECCIECAETLRKPLIIHCVRAFNEVLNLKKRLAPRQPWIIHGFAKNASTAHMLLDAGCYLSFGAALLNPDNHAAEALRQTPADRFFLETDDKLLAIQTVYERAAAIRNVGVPALKAQIENQFDILFPDLKNV